MKLSYRDKVIFIGLIVVIIIVAGIFIFIKPAVQSANAAKLVLEQKQAEQADVQAKIDTLPTLIQQLKTTAESIDELQKNFFDDQLPYQNEQMLWELLTANGVKVKSINTAYTVAENATEYMVNPDNILAYDLQMNADLYHSLPQEVYDKYNQTPVPVGTSIVMGVTEVTIGYKDAFDIANEFKFVDAVAKDERSMSVLTISTSDEKAAGDENAVNETEGEITMRIYSLFKMDTEKIKNETEASALEEAKTAAAATDTTATDAAATDTANAETTAAQ